MADLPPGVRPEVVAALVYADESDHARVLLASTAVEREFAGHLAGHLADIAGHQATMMLWLAELLRPWWGDPERKLMDVLSDVPEDVRAQAVKIIDLFSA